MASLGHSPGYFSTRYLRNGIYLCFGMKCFGSYSLALSSSLLQPGSSPFVVTGDLCPGTTVPKLESPATNRDKERRKYGFPCRPRLGASATAGNRLVIVNGDPFLRPIGSLSGQFLYRSNNPRRSAPRRAHSGAIHKCGRYFYAPIFRLDDG